MNVKQLKELLTQYPDDMDVVVFGYEDGYNDISTVQQINLVRDIHHEDYYGQHDEDYLNEYSDKEKTPSLFLGGKNELAD